MKPQFTIGVFGIIRNTQNEILLCHRTDYDLWNLPGGTLEHGEAPWEGVVREVKEETGLDVIVERIASIANKIEKHEIVFTFVCSITGGNLTLNTEADQITYFAVDKIPHNTSPRQVTRIKEFLENQEELVLKNEEGKSSIELLQEGKL